MSSIEWNKHGVFGVLSTAAFRRIFIRERGLDFGGIERNDKFKVIMMKPQLQLCLHAGRVSWMVC